MVSSLRSGVSRVSLAALLAALAVAPGRTVPAQAAAPRLVIAVTYEPATLDPQVNYDPPGLTILGNVYQTLVRASGETSATVVPDLATSWKASADGKTWTFRLRTGVRFHDGSVVDARAVQFTFNRLLKINQGGVSDFVPIQKVDAPSATTVVFHLKASFPSFLTSLTSLWGPGIVSPKTVLQHSVKNDLGQKWLYDHDAGSGPWTIARWAHGQQIVLAPFPGYYKGWSGPHVGEVVVQWPASSSTQRLGLEHGDIDIAMNLTPQDLDAVARENGIRVSEHTGQTIHFFGLNTTKGPLRSRLVRQALSYSMDYDGIVKAVYHGHARRMVGVGVKGAGKLHPRGDAVPLRSQEGGGPAGPGWLRQGLPVRSDLVYWRLPGPADDPDLAS